jgi:hypothetical protein
MRKVIAFALLGFILPTSGFTADTFRISGYYKNFFTVFDSPEPKTPEPTPSEPVIGAVSNRLRLNLFYKPGNRLSFQAAYNFSPRVQDASLFENQPVIAIDPSGYRVADLDSRVYPDENVPVGSFGIFQNLDRALITLNAGFADISVGRQAIAWGSARMLNPTDIIAPFTFEELDTEERIGVDAIRVQIPVGAMGEFDTGYIFGKVFAFGKSAFFLRSRLNAVETDVSILLLEFRENLLAGFDITRAIGGAGFWFEGAYVFTGAFDDDKTQSDNYLRASIGLDFSFSGKTYGAIEYHFSQAGAKKPEDYLTHLTQPAYTNGAVYLMGRHYLVSGLTYQITPLITFSGQALFNLSDPSMFLSPQIEYNIAQDIYISAGAFIGIGKRPLLFPPQNGGEDDAPIQQFRSEFGGYPNIYFSSFRIYF